MLCVLCPAARGPTGRTARLLVCCGLQTYTVGGTVVCAFISCRRARSADAARVSRTPVPGRAVACGGLTGDMAHDSSRRAFPLIPGKLARVRETDKSRGARGRGVVCGLTRAPNGLVHKERTESSAARRLERLLAQRARVLLRTVEPLANACRMKLVVARATLKLRDLARRRLHDGVADRALLNTWRARQQAVRAATPRLDVRAARTFEHFVDILLEKKQRVRD